MREARRGRCSETLTPGHRVAIEPKGPRISDGASGLGSNVSSWLGPPTIISKMTDRSGKRLGPSQDVSIAEREAERPETHAADAEEIST